MLPVTKICQISPLLLEFGGDAFAGVLRFCVHREIPTFHTIEVTAYKCEQIYLSL